MPSRKPPTRTRKTASRALPRLQLANVTVTLRDLDWFRPITEDMRVLPGEPAPNLMRVPEAEANRVLRETVRFVADLPRGSAGTVVWQQGPNELAVRTTGIQLACGAGLVTITVPVRCDQLAREEQVGVSLAVGTAERPAGLVMSSFSRASGPAVVTSVWSEALTAFAWEALVHLAQQLCAASGRDTHGRVLVPGSIGAGPKVLLLQPMARHALTWRP